MVNGCVLGRLVDEDDNPIPYLEVRVNVDTNIFLPDNKLEERITDNDGKFKIKFHEEDFKDFYDDNKPNLKLEIYIDSELLFTSPLMGNITDDVLDVGTIKIEGQNIGIKGRIINEKGNTIQGLVVMAWDRDFGPDEFIGSTLTDKDGYFNIRYPPQKYLKIIDKRPDIQIIIKDYLGVFELYRTDTYKDIEKTFLNIDEIILDSSWIHGWFITLNDNKKSRLIRNHQSEVLVDNDNSLKYIVDAINKAKSYIYLTQFEFFPDFIPIFLLDGKQENTECLMVDLLKRAEEREVKIRIILNENAVIPDNYADIFSKFKDTNVNVRRFPTSGPHVMHAKILVVDGKDSFIIGSPFRQDYWDTSQHLINDTRRDESHPVHDVSINIKGEAAVYIEEYFMEMWNYLSDEYFHGQDKLVLNSKPSSNTKEPVKSIMQVARSITPGTLNKNSERGILEGYRRAIGEAREYIYIENQYFTNRLLAKALKKALEKNPQLQLIMVTNQDPDIPTYRHQQNENLQVLGVDTDKEILEHPQIGVFTLWASKIVSSNPNSEKLHVQPIYVHSKVAIADDKWATVGTANLDGSSLNSADEFGIAVDPEKHLNMEINAFLMDCDNDNHVLKIRNELWGEHLGIGDLSSLNQLQQGWLGLWNKVAADNIASLNSKNPWMKSTILPYSFKISAESQIKSMKVDTRKINVMEK